MMKDIKCSKCGLTNIKKSENEDDFLHHESEYEPTKKLRKKLSKDIVV